MRSIFIRKTQEIKAVDDISFAIDQGELVGFIGPNGAGKTTTLKCLSGLLYPSTGSIKVFGFTPFERKKEFLKQISLVMGQKNQLWWDLPAMETFRLNKEIYEIEEKAFQKTLAELSGLLEIENLLTVPVRQLSLGQRMKMELVAALLHRPKVLFLDEPTIGLDVVMQKKVRDFIAEYNRQYSSTILLTSHYMTDVKQLCRRLIIIDHGRIVYDGDFKNLVMKYANFKIITVLFKERNLDKDKLAKIGQIKEIDLPKVVFAVPVAQATSIAARILQNLPVEDLNIEEPEIEEVIRLVFSKKKYG